jgi:hypothetical protein
VTLCSAIESLAHISSSAKALLSEIFDSDFERSVLGHFQASLYAPAGSIKRESLSKSIETFIKVRKKFGKKTDDRFLVSLESTINELTSKFSLELNIERDESESFSDFRDLSVLSENFLRSVRTDLKKNVTVGSYASLENYIRIHFDLLSEDFLTPLRDGLSKISENAQTSNCELYSYGYVNLVLML